MTASAEDLERRLVALADRLIAIDCKSETEQALHYLINIQRGRLRDAAGALFTARMDAELLCTVADAQLGGRK